MSHDEFLEMFRVEAADLLAELEAAVLELEESPQDMGCINRIFRSMHTIKGTASIYDMVDVMALSHAAETVFDQIRTGGRVVTRSILELALATKDVLATFIDTPDMADRSQLDLLLTTFAAMGEDSDAPPATAPVNPKAVCAPSAEPAAEAAPEPQAEPPTKTPAEIPTETPADPEPISYHLSLMPRPERFFVQDNPARLLADLRAMASEAVIIPRLERIPSLESLDPVDCHLWWDMALTTMQDENAVRDLFIFTEDKSRIVVERVGDFQAVEALILESASLAAANWAVSRAPELTEAAGTGEGRSEVADSGGEPEEDWPVSEDSALPTPTVAGDDAAPLSVAAPADPPASEAAGESAPAPVSAHVVPQAAPVPSGAMKKFSAADEASRDNRADASSVVRVETHKLDSMVDLVGELVIAQARLNQIANAGENAALQAVAEDMERLANSLRDRTLSMRMVPIGATFDSYRRMVRDLARDLGKDVRLEMSGEDTELDKTVIEQLHDPLMHILHNCLDHGLESPSEREQAGKTAQARVLLAAEHSGGHVLVSITDDGRGFDRERILARAEAQGLVAEGTPMEDREVYNLVFQPGFATPGSDGDGAETAVGLDEVKRSIELLRGGVELESTPGRGTKITIKLPLTLAIIEGLQVRVSGEIYVIPLAAVEECVELRRDDAAEASGKKIINLRSEIVPYVRLREWFGIGGERPLIEQIIITGGDGGRRTGIAVDEVVGQQQTVIKRIGGMFKELDEVSGATVQGDGTMALILDVPCLVRKVRRSLAAS